jgi:predicted unusual protein kinase regulating ubiquinone biosynthesis (AarF/ABC1/UbiB family)
VYFDQITTLTRYAHAMDDKDKQKAIPRSRLGRLSRIARMAGGVAVGMVGEGVRQLSEGNRPKVSDLILTPANAQRVAKQLATMRGAAMKVGQLLSMETNDILPAELSAILAQLRERAFVMPRSQLDAALTNAFGEHGVAIFAEFDFTPIAAASIGQVHRARTHDGKEIALKVQYPGVVESIDSDVDNIATLLRISNLLPKHMEIGALLEDAKKQLHEEADYAKEAGHLSTFQQVLSDSEKFLVPTFYPEYSNQKVLAMDYIVGEPIEELLDLSLDERDELVSNLFELMLRELFEFRLMQTDPNFGNYRYQLENKKVVLLDFGATRKFNASFVVHYKRLLRAVRANDAASIVSAADLLGYGASSASSEYQRLLVEIFTIALEPFAHAGPYDFANAKISERLRQMSEGAYAQKEFWQTPPTDILYLHRKLGGMYLLATKLEARVNCQKLVEPWLHRLR